VLCSHNRRSRQRCHHRVSEHTELHRADSF
jgi:hypothetical protein